MKALYKIVLFTLFTSTFVVAQNVEFEKSNFPDKKDLLKRFYSYLLRLLICWKLSFFFIVNMTYQIYIGVYKHSK